MTSVAPPARASRSALAGGAAIVAGPTSSYADRGWGDLRRPVTHAPAAIERTPPDPVPDIGRTAP
ncbi:hypothetical protein AB0I54_15965 [Streptomyces sp. NPDC050625]|uniref:hypothetical protein n=1 Tax=Streptomyces sp. NPDC050625 TaxID=3154629 RepID=UPI0034484EC8